MDYLVKSIGSDPFMLDYSGCSELNLRHEKDRLERLERLLVIRHFIWTAPLDNLLDDRVTEDILIGEIKQAVGKGNFICRR